VSVLGLDGKIRVEPASTQDDADPLRQQNSARKIPVMQLEDGSWIYDSPVILEYLDTLAGGGRIIPKDTKARFEALRLEALADGILDASILQVYEGRYRPPRSTSRSGSTCRPARLRAGSQLLRPHPRSSTRRPMSARSTVACVLGYRDFRFEGSWRKDHRAWSPGSRPSLRACRLCRDHAAAVVRRLVRHVPRARPNNKKPRSPGAFHLTAGSCAINISWSRCRVPN